MPNRKSGNDNQNVSNQQPQNGGEDVPVRSKRITADDLRGAAEAAQKAAEAAGQAAEAVVVALESGDIDESLVGQGADDNDQGQGRQDRGGDRGSQGQGRLAFEEFMAQLAGALRKAGNTLDISENAAWVKIESRRNGHKVYVAKGKTQVNRVESTLPPNLVPGAIEPDRKNGRIASWIPADPKAVSEAIRQLAMRDEQIRPPQRGGGQGDGGQGGGGQGGRGGGGQGQSRRPQAKFN